MPLSRHDKIPTHSLRIGMYVVELDRPWLDTPFLVQGFVIRSLAQLEILRNLCQYVYIDTGRSVQYDKIAQRPGAASNKRLTREKLQQLFKAPIKPISDSTSFDDELETAKTVYNDYEQMVRRLYDNVRNNHTIDMREVNSTISGIVDSVLRNPDACMLLAKLRIKGNYTYNHAIGSSIWAAAFGRQLGLPKRTIQSLATGALLCDVGKVHISDRILNSTARLSDEEVALIKGHVERGMQMLAEVKGVDEIARQMLAAHHERHNGGGYPKELKGNNIPVYGRIAGIVDAYDALINDKPYRQGIVASEAIKILYDVRDVDFQAELLEEFIQSVGIYPAGSLVELSNGEVGVVVSEHRRRRLRPRLLILLDANKTKLTERKFLDLFDVSHDESGNPLDIRKSLHPREYGIEENELFV